MIFRSFVALAAVSGAVSSSTPVAVVIATSRGSETIVVSYEAGYPALPAPALERLLPIEVSADAEWAHVRFADQPFRFLLGAPVVEHRGRVMHLVGGAYVLSDTLYVPLQWLTHFIPRLFGESYRYDPSQARLEEVGAVVPMVVATTNAPRVKETELPPANAAGLRFPHRVVVDAGHGGSDPGNPGRYLPRGVQEKHVNLAIAKALERELEKLGVDVIMTRTTDVLVPLYDRAPLCRDDCDLFVSIHVNAFARLGARGFETYFLDHAKNEAAERVAAMENQALRYEAELQTEPTSEMGFIFQDLLRNEYLRESARLADDIQQRAGLVHPGGGRYVAQANLAVLRGATRPAVLVETGYASNPEDGRFLASIAGQRRLASAIASGIVDYLRSYELKTAATSRR